MPGVPGAASLACISTGWLETNCYIIWEAESGKAAIIDPGTEDPRIPEWIQRRQLSVSYIINTHGHADHIGGNAWCKRTYKAPLLMHAADRKILHDPRANLSDMLGMQTISPDPDLVLEGSEVLILGKHSLAVIHTPGHTPGSICLLVDEKMLISGDTLFYSSIGRSDIPGGDMKTLQSSIRERLFVLPESTAVYPGHGPATTIGFEKANNPFMSPG
ncbi:MBL fold metallo-hydrolase [candidate division FCPU426 bacterium]|nr:MBL fold metallo-hydrolase [candidate division FCPU426 bacterium]